MNRITVKGQHAPYLNALLSVIAIINFALVKLLRTATKEKVREREKEAQNRVGTLKYIAAWLSPKSFYKIFVKLTRFRMGQPQN